MANLRKCICCGKQYEYCPNCDKSKNNPWMVTFDNEICKELFNKVSLYNTRRITKEDVRDFVARKGITDFSMYEQPIRKVLEETGGYSFGRTSTVPDKTPAKDEDANGSTPWRRKKKRKYGYGI